MNRIDRISAILIQLQSKRVVKAQEIADRFSISLRTVYRDIRTLEEAGIPLIGEAGIGYALMEGYRLPPVMFSKEEATAFITAEKLIEKFTDHTTDAHYKSAMYKIKAVLRTTEKDYVEDLSSRIEILSCRVRTGTDADGSHMQQLLRGITDKKVISITYLARQDEPATERDIEPIGIFYQGARWHIIAWCQLREDYRDFRIDRITALKPSGRSFSGRHPSLQEYLKQVANERELQPVCISFDKEAALFLGEQKYYYGYVSEKPEGDRVEMTFLVHSLCGTARWLLSFTHKARVIYPDVLREEIKGLVHKLYAHYTELAEVY